MKMEEGLICIEGNIGSGKTSLLNILSKSIDCISICEEVPNVGLLEKFYAQENVDNFYLELLFLEKRYSLLRDGYINSRLNISDFSFFRSLIISRVNLNDDQFRLFQDNFHKLYSLVVKPTLIVYLQSDVEILKANIKKRGRRLEENIEAEYLKETNIEYNNYFANFNSTNLLIIKTNGRDFINNTVNKNLVLNAIFDCYNKCNGNNSEIRVETLLLM